MRTVAVALVAVTVVACEGTPAVEEGVADGGGVAAPDGAPPGAPIDAAVGGAADYGQNGPTAFTMSVEHVANGGDAFDVTVFMPDSPGLHPAVSFSCGSTQTAAGYLEYGERLASHGIAMFLTDDPGALTNTADVVPRAVHVVETWIPAMYGDRIDVTRIGLGGHSRGGAVSLLAAEHGLKSKVVAWFGLDPVDNQFLLTPGQFARTDMAAIGIPTGFLGAEVISNCAPAADGYQLLFPLAPDPTVLVVGVGAGHVQFENASGCTACGICSPAGTADAQVVLEYSLRYFTAFFARELLGDAAVGARFEGAGGPSDVAAGLVVIE